MSLFPFTPQLVTVSISSPLILSWTYFSQTSLPKTDRNCFVKAIHRIHDTKPKDHSSAFVFLHLSAVFGKADLWKTILSWLLGHIVFCLLSSHSLSVSFAGASSSASFLNVVIPTSGLLVLFFYNRSHLDSWPESICPWVPSLCLQPHLSNESHSCYLGHILIYSHLDAQWKAQTRPK